MKLFLILMAMMLLACGKDNDAPLPSNPQGKFQDIIGKYLVHDSTVTRDPGVVYLEVIGRGKGSDQRIRPDGIIETYSSPNSTRMINYAFKAPDSLFVWDLGTDRHYNWFTTVSMPTSNHFIKRQKMQSRIMEFHYTAE